MFHGAGLGGIRLRVKGGARLGIDEQRADAATPELDGEHEAARPAACDQDIGFDNRPALSTRVEDEVIFQCLVSRGCAA